MHIERVTGLVKNRYYILDGPIPITLVKSMSNELYKQTPIIVKLVTVCAYLCNLSTHGSDKLGWLFLHDFIKNFGKYPWLLA